MDASNIRRRSPTLIMKSHYIFESLYYVKERTRTRRRPILNVLGQAREINFSRGERFSSGGIFFVYLRMVLNGYPSHGVVGVIIPHDVKQAALHLFCCVKETLHPAKEMAFDVV